MVEWISDRNGNSGLLDTRLPITCLWRVLFSFRLYKVGVTNTNAQEGRFFFYILKGTAKYLVIKIYEISQLKILPILVLETTICSLNKMH